jgi:hypothetical protein
MPTVLRLRGLRFVIYPNDHRPAHVHVAGHGCEAVFNLGCSAGAVEERENYGFSRREIRNVRRIVSANLGDLCRAWEELHGVE